MGKVLVEAAIGGAFGAALDLTLIVRRGEVTAPWATAIVALGLGLALAVLVLVPALLGLRAGGRHRAIRGVVDRLRTPGAPRVEALVVVGVALVAWLVLWGLAFASISALYGTMKRPGGPAMIGATAIAVGAVVLALVASAGGAHLARRAGRVAALARVTSGRPGWALALAGLVAAAGAVHAAFALGVPLWDATPAYVGVAAAAGALVASAARAGDRVGARGRAAVAVGVVALVAAALVLVGREPAARRAAAERGVLGAGALHALWWLTDDDGDRTADRFGGHDCDDGDAAIGPRAREVPGNGVDDNCRLGDASPDALGPRLHARPSTTPGAPRADIVLITIDTVRADHVGAWGYARPTTPTIDALAARGARFARAVSPYPLTRHAVPALLYGRYPSAMAKPRTRRGTALSEVLRRAGYDTAVVTTVGRIRDGVFDGFGEMIEARGAAGITDAAAAWVRARPADRPYFVWLHYMDPHEPYQPAARPFGDDAVARYDAEIANVDAQIGELLGALEALGRPRSPVVVVTSDHGESFGEHGQRFHDRGLLEPQTWVPLVIAAPGGASTVVDAPVSLVDIAPTLLDLVGLEAPRGMNGVSLAAAVREGGAIPARPVLAEWSSSKPPHRQQVSVHDGAHVVIRDVIGWTHAVHDLVADPGQRHDLSETPLGAELLRRLDEAIERERAVLPGEPR